MTKHSGGGTLKKRKRTNSATTREHNLELQLLMNYGTESISICSLVGGRVIRVFSILALPTSNSELDRGNGWSAVFINRCLGQLGMVLDDAVWNWLILEYNQSAHLLHFTAIFVHVEEWGWLIFLLYSSDLAKANYRDQIHKNCNEMKLLMQNCVGGPLGLSCVYFEYLVVFVMSDFSSSLLVLLICCFNLPCTTYALMSHV